MTNSLPPQTKIALQEFGLVLKRIYLRLKAEGFVLKDGRLIKPA